ncbi:PAS domain S-box protein, partial [Thermodesulfobacteriota bacterium]
MDNITKEIVSCNPAAERIFGYKQKELIGQKTGCLHLNQEMQQKFRKMLHPTADKGEVFRCEYQMKRKDGSTFISAHTVTGTFDGKGKRITGVHVIRDITEHKRAQEALSTLYIISQAINQTLDLELVLNVALDKVIKVLNVDAALIRLWEEETQELVLKFYKGYTAQEIKHVVIRRKAGEGSAWKSLRAGGPKIKTKSPESDDSFRTKAGFLFSAQFPLNSKHHLLGIMGIHQRTPRKFSPDEIELLANVGHQIGVAIENASLYQQTQHT